METASLVGQIYESIGDSEAFENMLAQVAHSSRSRGSQFGLMDQAGRWIQSAVVGLDTSKLPLYVNHYAAEDQRRPQFNLYPGRWIPCQNTLTDPAAFERSALVNEFLDKNDARYCLFVAFPVEPRHSLGLSMMRARRDGHYGDEEVRQLAPLLPHVKRAMSLHIRIGRLESALTSLDALVDRIPAPSILVDRNGALRYANSSGQEALRKARYLLLEGGCVVPRSPGQVIQFMDLLGTALSNETSTSAAQRSTSMRLLDGDGRAAVLVIQGLRGQANLGGMPRADAALFLIGSDETPPVNSTRLQMAFGFTPAEARLAEFLLNGRNIKEIAEELRVGRETLKSQLRSLFSKTDTRRQGELIAVLLSSISLSVT